MTTRNLKHLLNRLPALVCLLLWNTVGADPGPPTQDREAILSMAGEYRVFFEFEEMVSLQPGYERTKPYYEEARESVIVIEDTGDRIALQHILSIGTGDKIVKHWKQVWTWQDTRITEFQGNNQWKVREISPDEAEGTWSQLVTQVDDSPRYESYAAWNHSGGYSRWESEKTYRPLPRREHTKRDDYDVLVAVNRHALTPEGWVHGQDNLKLVLSAEGEVDHYIARERGLNVYERLEGEKVPERVESYWSNTGDFWSKVSEYWSAVEAGTPEFSIKKEVDEESLMMTLAMVAKAIDEGEKEIPSKEEVASLVVPFVDK
ncbi:MAG: DUF6607 family protein [Verrucomicrobiota bacterium]